MRRTTAAAVTAVALILGTVALTMPSNPQHPTKGMTVIDMWTGPTPVTSQFPHNEPNGIRLLLGKIKSIETELRDARSHLPGSGITNPMLATPVVPGAIYFSATDFSLDATWTTVATSTVIVPPNVTSAVVSVVSRVLAYNGSTDPAGDVFHSQPVVGAFSGSAMWTAFALPNNQVVDIAPLTVVLTGLTPGDTFPLAIKVQTGAYAWGSSSFNVAEMSGSILWFR